VLTRLIAVVLLCSRMKAKVAKSTKPLQPTQTDAESVSGMSGEEKRCAFGSRAPQKRVHDITVPVEGSLKRRSLGIGRRGVG